jgi:predicted dienelactone hydrolase
VHLLKGMGRLPLLSVSLTFCLFACGFPLLAHAAETKLPSVQTGDYDPLHLHDGSAAVIHDDTVHDGARNREIPCRVFLPAGSASAPVILFSHGLGGSREGSAYLGRHWAGRGYVVIFLQHHGSDAAVWRDTVRSERFAAMAKAASLDNFMARVADVPAVLTAMSTWNGLNGHRLRGRLDTTRVGMSGHSFGAITTQAVSGQSFPTAGQRFSDSRIKAALMMSPSAPRVGSPTTAFAKVNIPWMLMTGTDDVSPIGDTDVASRLAVFPALPVGKKYELVLDAAEHSAFSDRELPGDKLRRNPNHHRVILALSTAFWDTTLREDVAAQSWLATEASVRSVLEAKDRWRTK